MYEKTLLLSLLTPNVYIFSTSKSKLMTYSNLTLTQMASSLMFQVFLSHKAND